MTRGGRLFPDANSRAAASRWVVPPIVNEMDPYCTRLVQRNNKSNEYSLNLRYSS